MGRACARCGRTLSPRHGADAILRPGEAATTLCEICLREPVHAAPEDARRAMFLLLRQAEAAALLAASLAKEARARGAWALKVDEAEEEALRCLRAVVAAGDTLTQGDPILDGLPAAARAARAAADALDAAVRALRST